jgi:hypothetical protein
VHRKCRTNVKIHKIRAIKEAGGKRKIRKKLIKLRGRSGKNNGL